MVFILIWHSQNATTWIFEGFLPILLYMLDSEINIFIDMGNNLEVCFF